jgi:hypothetical protein
MDRICEVIKALGGPARVARACGVSCAAVADWQLRNRIPARHRLTLWRMAKERGLDWRPPGAEGLDLVILPATAQQDAEPPAFTQRSHAEAAE